MRTARTLAALVLAAVAAAAAAGGQRLSLDGYADGGGAITVLHGGDVADPYFAMQALLLAHENGLDATAHAVKFADWLVPHQKPDGTFDRFCRGADGRWASCRAADADDSLLAMWMHLLDTMPTERARKPAWAKSYRVAQAALDHLYQPSRGVYMVSPIHLHGLFMDNLEVWAYLAQAPLPGHAARASALARAIQSTFWEPVDRRYLVSTQLEQRARETAFYPDHVAQVFPLLVGFPPGALEPRAHYRAWMSEHRAAWLAQGRTDYPWGILAVLALRQGDRASAACWLREAGSLRHSARWAVTDEVSFQIAAARGVSPAPAGASCR